jgi:protease I
MSKKLVDFKVAILVANGFEESEMVEPRQALRDAGAHTDIISPEEESVRAWVHGDWSQSYKVDIPLSGAQVSDYHALLLPGGVMNPDTLRMYPQAIDFIKRMGEKCKPIAAICHGPWTLINAGLVKRKQVTSWPSIRIDLENAGAEWIDKEVVTDGTIVTSRKPADIPMFNQAFIELCVKHWS